ncbi:MAG: LytR family transcriptional regulator [Actinobacteria bacterium]|nr:MAG: LytR family transcriptional regulator [Actinomycetota bacterium]
MSWSSARNPRESAAFGGRCRTWSTAWQRSRSRESRERVARRPAGKHSMRRASEVDRVEPASTTAETPRETSRRRSAESFRDGQRRRAKRNKTLLGCLGAFVLVCAPAALAVAGYLGGWQNKLTKNYRNNDALMVALKPKDSSVVRTVTEPFWMVVVGVDARPGETASRSDTILMVHVDPNRRTATVVSIPRDSRARIRGHGHNKINAALFFGGPELMIETLEDTTGADITHYLAIDFNGFKEIVDAMGGVWVDVPERIEDKKAANYDRRSYIVDPGMQKLDGAHALTFVRSRNFPEGDIARIRNQQVFLRALAKQVLSLGNVFRVKGILDAVARNAETDLTVTDMFGLASDLMKMKEESLETVTLPGAPKMMSGVSYIILDEEGVKEMIAKIDAGESVTGSATAVAGSGQTTVTPTMVTVTVRNGVGVAGIATDAANELEKKGFRIQEVGNAGQFVYDKTLVVYNTDKRKADLVRTQLGVGDTVESRGMYSFKTDVLVVVGRDWRASTAGSEDE